MHVNIPEKNWHAKSPILMAEGLLNISPACCGQLVKMLITPVPYWIFGSNQLTVIYTNIC